MCSVIVKFSNETSGKFQSSTSTKIRQNLQCALIFKISICPKIRYKELQTDYFDALCLCKERLLLLCFKSLQ